MRVVVTVIGKDKVGIVAAVATACAKEQMNIVDIKGERVKHLLIEEKANIQKEFFVSVSTDRSTQKPVIMACGEGGVEIEELAKTNPEKIIIYHVDPLKEFLPYEAREIARKMDVGSELVSSIGSIIWKLYNVYQNYDAEIAEINPLILTDEGLIAADAKLEIEDDALFRHKDLVELNYYKKKEFAFVKLDGDIAVIGNGAGLTVMENILQGNPDIKAVFAHNDEMALGALEAITALGKDIKVIGFDATDDAVAAVKAGTLAATVAQKPDIIGVKAIETAIAYLNGEKVEENVPVELELITK